MTFLGNDPGVIGIDDLMSTIIVKDRRLDGVGTRQPYFDRIACPVDSIADAVEDFGGHLRGRSVVCEANVFSDLTKVPARKISCRAL